MTEQTSELLRGPDRPSPGEIEALRDLLAAQAQACLNRAEMYIEWIARIAEAERPQLRVVGKGE